ncbi:hypothetical protein P153DRAFT_289941, partial [Dothidotthia symphoricarpi CBS 119687]
VIVLSFALVVLIISNTVSPLIRYFFTTGPDVAMNISSLATRNNAHILLPANGTFLDTAEHAKLLKDLRVCFGDIDSNAEVGNLAVGSDGVEESGINRVRKGRLYG